MANPENRPRDIFISCFDTAPLALDLDFAVHGLENEFQTGINALAKLTDGKVHLGVNSNTQPSTVFSNCKGVEMHKFKGPHPAGNVGVQIHRVAPINKGEHVWTLSPQDVIIIGRLFLTGKFDAQRHIAVAGSQVEKPRYYKSLMGTSLKNILNGNLKAGTSRVISGTVLTGSQIKPDGYLGFYDQQISVIPEGGQDEFFGWIAPNLNKFSIFARPVFLDATR
ncbi:MAG: hypothetical protein U5L96_03290 [Owenweeksia sp.]|nr:hypothetical protein [Owenweeksia sp.]